MFDQNFNPDGHQNKSADQVQFQIQFAPEPASEKDAEGRESEGYDADGGRFQHQRGFQYGQRDAYGQRVDTGGHPQAAKRFIAEGVEFTLFIVGVQPVVNHFAPQVEEQTKGDPMIERADIAFEAYSHQIAHGGHPGLKETEYGGYFYNISGGTIPDNGSSRYRYGQAIHRQAYREQDDFRE